MTLLHENPSPPKSISARNGIERMAAELQSTEKSCNDSDSYNILFLYPVYWQQPEKPNFETGRRDIIFEQPGHLRLS
jgi:hypothetical protein